jgi:hypothetical protein
MRLVAATFVVGASIAVGAVNGVAAPKTATPFELVVAGFNQQVPQSTDFPFGIRHAGTFTASSPFCASGTFADLTNDFLDSWVDSRLYTCADGSGTLTTEQEDWFELKPPYTSTWRILGGTGRYADLRGKGSFLGGPPLTGCPCDPLNVTYHSTFSGIVDFDVVGPTITVSKAKVTKLRRPPGSYSLRLRLAMRDNEEGSAIAYMVAVEPAGGGLYLAQTTGSSPAGTVTTTLRIRPQKGARKILLHARAEDPLGNWRWVTRRLTLPR